MRARTASLSPRPDPGASGEVGSGDAIARVVTLEPGIYAFRLALETRWRLPIAGFPLPAVEVCPASDRADGIEITDNFGRAGSWLGGSCKMLFVKSPDGGPVVITAYLAREPGVPPVGLEILRIGPADDWGDSRPESARVPNLPPFLTLSLAAADRAPDEGQPVSLDIVAHVRGRGDVRFVDAASAGRLGRGMWIEAFTIASPDEAVATAVEYKGLSAGGSETPWIACGAPCGTTGRGIPLVGFAIRQKAGLGGARFDCEYAGYFQSGETSGPVRNGAPCRSGRDNDPLEGMEVRIVPRPSRRDPAPS